MGIHPKECAAFVIVPDKNCKFEMSQNVSLSKNVWQDLESFLNDYQGEDEDPVNYIYIFSEQSHKQDSASDVEITMPRAYYSTEDSYIDVSDSDNYDYYGYITVELLNEESEERDDTSLLWNISEHIEVSQKAYCQVPRHHAPKPEYAVPPVPSLEERKLKQSIAVAKTVERLEKFSISSDRRRLLLLRRK